MADSSFCLVLLSFCLSFALERFSVELRSFNPDTFSSLVLPLSDLIKLIYDFHVEQNLFKEIIRLLDLLTTLFFGSTLVHL